MVTSDLSADGQHNEKLLRNAVWNNVRQGRIGQYSVSSEGFQFSLLRGKTTAGAWNAAWRLLDRIKKKVGTCSCFIKRRTVACQVALFSVAKRC